MKYMKLSNKIKSTIGWKTNDINVKSFCSYLPEEKSTKTAIADIFFEKSLTVLTI